MTYRLYIAVPCRAGFYIRNIATDKDKKRKYDVIIITDYYIIHAFFVNIST